jgi:hypothetical protein
MAPEPDTLWRYWQHRPRFTQREHRGIASSHYEKPSGCIGREARSVKYLCLSLLALRAPISRFFVCPPGLIRWFGGGIHCFVDNNESGLRFYLFCLGLAYCRFKSSSCGPHLFGINGHALTAWRVSPLTCPSATDWFIQYI